MRSLVGGGSLKLELKLVVHILESGSLKRLLGVLRGILRTIIRLNSYQL